MSGRDVYDRVHPIAMHTCFGVRGNYIQDLCFLKCRRVREISMILVNPIAMHTHLKLAEIMLRVCGILMSS